MNDLSNEKIALLKQAIKYIRHDRDQLKRAEYSDLSMKGFNRSILVLEEMIEEIKEREKENEKFRSKI